jgi:hypothetical protein
MALNAYTIDAHKNGVVFVCKRTLEEEMSADTLVSAASS